MKTYYTWICDNDEMGPFFDTKAECIDDAIDYSEEHFLVDHVCFKLYSYTTDDNMHSADYDVDDKKLVFLFNFNA